jgi:hypothetical protein
MARYRTKVKLVRAWQLTDEALDASYPSDMHIKSVIYDPIRRCAFIRTQKNNTCVHARVHVGDWIVRGEDGELSRCAAADFSNRYELVED